MGEYREIDDSRTSVKKKKSYVFMGKIKGNGSSKMTMNYEGQIS